MNTQNQPKLAAFPPSAETVKRAHVTADDYAQMYAASVSDPDAFWAEHGKRIDWIKPYTKVKNTRFHPGQCRYQLVRGRHAERRRQLHRPASGDPRRSDRDHLGAG